LIDIFLDESLKLCIAGDGFLNGRDLVPRDVAGDILAILSALMIVERAVGTFAQDGELAPFEARNLGGLLEQRLRVWFGIHGATVCLCIYYVTKKRPNKSD
jgi:hypothetical protein